MTWILLVASVSWAQDVSLARPPQSSPSPSECPESFPLRAGEAPPTGLIASGCVVRCSAVAEPTSSFAYLLKLEQYAIGLEEVHRLDVARLTGERDFYKTKIEDLTESTPWYKRPRSARWLGRLEASIVAGAFVAGYVAMERTDPHE